MKQITSLNEKEQNLLRKQISGLQDDNERINRLYQVVEREAFTGNREAYGSQRQVIGEKQALEEATSYRKDMPNLPY